MIAIASILILSSADVALAEGDAALGKRVFNKCKACHSLKEGGRKIGPSLWAVLGRKAGTVEGYRYSRAFVASNVVWGSETIAKFLKAPKKFVKGNKMAFPGLRKPKDIANVLAYIGANIK